VSPHEFVTLPHLPLHAGGRGGGGHDGQPWSVPPQPSLTPVPVGSQTPSTPPSTLTPQASGVQHSPLSVLHFWGVVHVTGVGQVMVTPQPLSVALQLSAQSACVGGTHATHWCVVASHTSGLAHVPQFTSTPHESGMNPHWAPCAAHDAFVPH